MNIAFEKKVEANLKDECNEKTVFKIGSCSLHKVNNSFLNALDVMDFDFDGIANDLCFLSKNQRW